MNGWSLHISSSTSSFFALSYIDVPAPFLCTVCLHGQGRTWMNSTCTAWTKTKSRLDLKPALHLVLKRCWAKGKRQDKNVRGFRLAFSQKLTVNAPSSTSACITHCAMAMAIRSLTCTQARRPNACHDLLEACWGCCSFCCPLAFCARTLCSSLPSRLMNFSNWGHHSASLLRLRMINWRGMS